ncbi:hypothetical protein H4S02_000163 [Coemansia sp. RSA 2611]|nr:hypothetical protein IWW54_004863 [Coemansia sp. RSA 2705]KAJ2370392.1 hypothetical protein H4S01_000398 [Coemansia sp. RSA 2610]KAJ2393501.1 hypothetical protein H4S02_000163 [Coemansia sp. RSA 2611]
MPSEQTSASTGASTPTQGPARPPSLPFDNKQLASHAKRQAWGWFTSRLSSDLPESMGVGEKKRGLVLVSRLHTPTLPTWRIVLATLSGALNSSFLIAGGLTILYGGPGGALVAFIMAIIVLYMVMTSLMEVGSRMPDDIPYYLYATRVLGPTVGVALAWSFWLLWIVILVYEMVAGGFIIQYWLPHVDRAIWCLVLFLACISIVIIDSRMYSAAESTLTLVTTGALIAAVIVGSLAAAGKLGDEKYGFETWRSEEGPFVGGFLGVVGASIFANFSVHNVEVGAIMALKSPSRYSRKLVPIAICCTLAVVLLPSIFVIGLLLSPDDPWFEKESFDSAEGSSLTYVFEKAGIMPAAHVINAILLISALLDCCVGLYVATTVLQDLADRGLAPKFLQSPENRDRALAPYSMGLCCMVALGIWALTFIRVNSAVVLLAGVIGISGVITWGSIAIMHCVVRWSKRYRHTASEDAYRSVLFPLNPILCLLVEVGSVIALLYVVGEIGFDTELFLFDTLGIFVFIILVIAAAVAQHFGKCRC